jgi:hypothetical protein
MCVLDTDSVPECRAASCSAQDLYFGKDDGDRIRPKVTENEAKEARAIVIKARPRVFALAFVAFGSFGNLTDVTCLEYS